jgi:serine/threonine protein kinase
MSDSDQVSNRVGDYEILEFLGAGGMGKVFKVRNVISDRVEAMKVLLPELTAQDELIKRFLNEIKLVATLEHPNIASLHTALTIQGQFVMVMEFVEGTTVAKLLENGAIPVSQAVAYTSQVLSALSYAHAKGIIHRDIKPANMMLTPDGTIKLMDFGIARSNKESGLTTVGTTLGSLYYMSPEQVKGEPIDGRSDIYALGISLYEMVTGKKPFETGTDYSIMAAHLDMAPKPPIEIRPDLPAALNEIILMAVAKEPAQRFQSPDAMRRALQNVGGSAPTAAYTPAATGAPSPTMGATAAFAATAPTASVPVMAAVTPQPSASQTNYVPPAEAPRSGGHRGLYMTLGALIVLAGLAAAGLYIPKLYKTHAEESNQQSTPAPQAPASLSTTTPSTPPPDTTPAVSTSPATPPDASVPPTTNASAPSATSPATPTVPPVRTTRQLAKSGTANVGRSSAADSSGNAQPTQDAAARAADEQALKQVDHESSLLNTRMASADAALNTMKGAQAQQGYGLRSDIVSAQERLHMNLAKLDAAIQNHDLKAAKHYQDLCDRDAETIDKFLGH